MQTWNTVEEFLAVPGTIPIGDMHKGQRFQAFDGRTYTRVSEHHGAVTVRRDDGFATWFAACAHGIPIRKCTRQTEYGMTWSRECGIEIKDPTTPYCAEHTQDSKELYPHLA